MKSNRAVVRITDAERVLRWVRANSGDNRVTRLLRAADIRRKASQYRRGPRITNARTGEVHPAFYDQPKPGRENEFLNATESINSILLELRGTAPNLAFSKKGRWTITKIPTQGLDLHAESHGLELEPACPRNLSGHEFQSGFCVHCQTDEATSRTRVLTFPQLSDVNEVYALWAVCNLAERGLLSRIRQCERPNCKIWFYTARQKKRFHSTNCQQLAYRAVPEHKDEHRQTVKKLYHQHKDRARKGRAFEHYSEAERKRGRSK